MSGSRWLVVPIRSKAPVPGGGWVGLVAEPFKLVPGARNLPWLPGVGVVCIQISLLPAWTEQVTQPELAG